MRSFVRVSQFDAHDSIRGMHRLLRGHMTERCARGPLFRLIDEEKLNFGRLAPAAEALAPRLQKRPNLPIYATFRFRLPCSFAREWAFPKTTQNPDMRPT
jgi:hypothetical protein